MLNLVLVTILPYVSTYHIQGTRWTTSVHATFLNTYGTLPTVMSCVGVEGQEEQRIRIRIVERETHGRYLLHEPRSIDMLDDANEALCVRT